ncbi:MAG: HEAT repeat domain-containing protein [Gallionella sp.]|nr:HEAT repeat domain-containing protein [Gallionella sp.]
MVRWGAAQALGQIKDPSTVPALLVALKDKDGMVFRRAAIAIAIEKIDLGTELCPD